MKHRVKLHKLGLDKDHRKALLRNLATSILLQGLNEEQINRQVVTTLHKAKAVKGLVDRLITYGKKGDLSARRQALKFIKDKRAFRGLFDVLRERYQNRKGGYTRVLKISSNRHGDNAQMAIITLVDDEITPRLKKKPSKSKQKAAVDTEPSTQEEKGKKTKGAKKTGEKKAKAAPSEKKVKPAEEKAEVKAEIPDKAEAAPTEEPVKTAKEKPAAKAESPAKEETKSKAEKPEKAEEKTKETSDKSEKSSKAEVKKTEEKPKPKKEPAAAKKPKSKAAPEKSKEPQTKVKDKSDSDKKDKPKPTAKKESPAKSDKPEKEQKE
jgi:large subunit ribosomal protein L17